MLTRPDSFDNPIWSPYKDYIKVDKMYGDLEDDFVVSQSIMNLLEISMNIFALQRLFAGHVKQAMIVALIVSTMTCSKTILYFVMEVVSGFKNTSHNDNFTLFLLYVFPNGVWIFVPGAIVFVLSSRFVSSKAPPSKKVSKSRTRSKSKTPSKSTRRSARLSRKRSS